MDLTRRHVLTGFGGLAVAGAGTVARAQGAFPRTPPAEGPLTLPRKADFAIGEGRTYINCAFIHPMSIASAENVQRYVRARSTPDGEEWERINIKAEFAALINAKPSEIAFVPNTTSGENLVVNGLGLPGSGGNVVTDALHFEGALIHLKALQKDGLDVRTVMPRDWRIHMRDLERVVDKKTKLIEISHVAMFTGFEHDLKAVCDLAHAHGALVYVDIAHGRGLLRLLELQVADGRLRPRLPLRARRPARTHRPPLAVRLLHGVEHRDAFPASRFALLRATDVRPGH
jgi:hypothetical protein